MADLEEDVRLRRDAGRQASTTSDTLKPCLCGGAAERLRKVRDPMRGPPLERQHYVRCMACGARTQTFATRDEATTAWNRRASLSGSPEGGEPSEREMVFRNVAHTLTTLPDVPSNPQWVALPKNIRDEWLRALRLPSSEGQHHE